MLLTLFFTLKYLQEVLLPRVFATVIKKKIEDDNKLSKNKFFGQILTYNKRSACG